jgi:hypothetical protein
MIWARHIAGMRKVKNDYKFLLKKVNERNHLGDRGVDEKIILKLILWKQLFLNTVMNLRIPQNLRLWCI